VALREAGSGGIKATPKLSCKLFQIQRVFVQAFPKKALAVLWNFNALQGTQIKMFHSKLFQRRRPPFSLIPDVVAPHSAGPRRSGARSAVRGRLCCRRAGREFMSAGSGLVSDTGRTKFEHSTNSDSWKGKFDIEIDAAQRIHRGYAQGGRARRMSGPQLYCPDVIDNAISPG